MITPNGVSQPTIPGSRKTHNNQGDNMAIGLAGGLGQALVAGSNQLTDSMKEERDRKRQEAIQDETRKRINQTWDQQQQDKEVSDLSDANDVLSVVDPKIVPMAIPIPQLSYEEAAELLVLLLRRLAILSPMCELLCLRRKQVDRDRRILR